MKIPFVKTPLTGSEFKYLTDSINSGFHSGLGPYSKKVNDFIENKFKIGKSFLTTSCTDALEMCSFLVNGEPGDEFIVPSYTFSSTANAFVSRGMVPVWAEIDEKTLNINPNCIENLITEKTKAIVIIHYAGIPSDMDEIMKIAEKHNLPVIEDAAQAFNSKYKGNYAGSIADLSTFSFHATKSYSCGEGGALGVNNIKYFERAEYLLEKGTDRSKVIQGLQNKYSWVDNGSSFLLSDILASILYGQILQLDELQSKRKVLFDTYTEIFSSFKEILNLQFLETPKYAQGNYHAFWVLFRTEVDRNNFLKLSREMGISPYIGYISLHNSPMGLKCGSKRINLDFTEAVESRIARLPFYTMEPDELIHLKNSLEKVLIKLKK